MPIWWYWPTVSGMRQTSGLPPCPCLIIKLLLMNPTQNVLYLACILPNLSASTNKTFVELEAYSQPCRSQLPNTFISRHHWQFNPFHDGLIVSCFTERIFACNERGTSSLTTGYWRITRTKNSHPIRRQSIVASRNSYLVTADKLCSHFQLIRLASTKTATPHHWKLQDRSIVHGW